MKIDSVGLRLSKSEGDKRVSSVARVRIPKKDTVRVLKQMRKHLRAGWLGQRDIWVAALDEVIVLLKTK